MGGLPVAKSGADMTPKRPRDPNQLAKSIIDIATGQQPSPVDRTEGPSTERPQEEKPEKKRSLRNQSSAGHSR
jgi:hypothetical protein